MSVAISLLVIGLGAILTWTVSAEVAGVDVHVVGIVLLVLGLAGLVVALVRAFAHESWGEE